MIKIRTYGDPVLRVKAVPVGSIDKYLLKLADGMIELMLEKSGVGLAAQQVGETTRIFVMHVAPQYDLDKTSGKRLNPDLNGPIIMINPVIRPHGKIFSQDEGCLSIPEIHAPVCRSYEVSVSFLDRHGNQQQISARGLMARVIQHEFDHLNGTLFTDRLSLVKKLSLIPRLQRLKRTTLSG